ncbi:hypothetical protein [Legionella nagasakiensis]|uniref:hypothetical protein n=1 Tax=Legionella nagasakiensis TaxID=535290 RepID=UPI001055E5DD|nr:hypothetical protein [Legionella nagasakiensis]
MAAFKKYVGNYIEVASTLFRDLPSHTPNLIEGSTKSTYDHQIAADLPRTHYVSYQYPVAEIQHRLQDTSHLYDDATETLKDEKKPLAYTQGNFDGRIFTRARINTLPGYPENSFIAHEHAGGINSYYNDICFSYIDDDGRNCAFSIAFLRDDPDPEKSIKRPFSLAIIRNTTAAPSDREVLYLTHPTLVPETSPCGLVKVTFDPNTASWPDLDRLLQGKNGVVLYNDHLYYVNRMDQSITPIPEHTDNQEQLARLKASIASMQDNQFRLIDHDEVELIQSVANFIELASPRDLGEEIEEEGVPDEAFAFLRSASISQLLSGIIDGDSVNYERFVSLAERIISNHNIDDRDYRTTLLQKYITFAQTIPHGDDLDEHLAALAEATQNDVDFFKLDHFERALKTMFAKVNERLDTLEDEEAKKRFKLQNQLALYAIELELQASILSEEKQTNIKEALLKQATAIQRLSENPPLDKNFPTLVAETLQDALKKQKVGLAETHQQDIKKIVTDNEQELIKLEKEKPVKPNFWQRNRTALLIGATALLLAVSLALVLTGVLAPLGIALAAGSLASAAAMGLTATAGAFTIAAGAKIAYDEKQFAKRLTLHEEKVQRCKDSLNPKLERSDADHRQKLQAFEVPFQRLSQELASPLHSPADQVLPVAPMRRARSLSDVSLGASRETLLGATAPLRRSRSLSDVRDEDHLDLGHTL